MSIAELDPPGADLRFKRPIRLFAFLTELWHAKELTVTLAERELRVRYKQAVLGFGWAIVTPVMLMLALTVFFQNVAKVDTGGVPYALFSYVGLIPWTFFSIAVSTGGNSLVTNLSLLNKVYCPREVFPLASVIVAGVDALVATSVLLVLFAILGFAPKETSYWVPVLLLIQVAFALGVAFLISSVLVYLRDLRHALPILLQLGLFATPVAFPLDTMVPERFQAVYVAINPLAAVIHGYRHTVLMGESPDPTLLGIAAASAFTILLVGYVTFKKIETGFADVA